MSHHGQSRELLAEIPLPSHPQCDIKCANGLYPGSGVSRETQATVHWAVTASIRHGCQHKAVGI